MAQFRLFVDSNVGYDIDPLWTYAEEDRKIESRHRTRSGRNFIYKWGEYKRFKVPVSFVTLSFKNAINGYWNSNTELLFMEVDNESSISSVTIVNKKLPISKAIEPYNDLFIGIIELETY